MKEKVLALGLLIRFSALGGTIVMVLLGAGTVSPTPGLWRVLGLIGVGIAFHIYSYVLNDVVDLPIDRSEPRRENFPLVRGTISPQAALVVALIQFPLALLITYWNQGSLPAYAALTASFICLGLYNLWGKRAAFPPLTDFVQGLGWGGRGVYGAYIAANYLSQASIVLLTYLVIMILMANGVHGSVRDLENDYRCGVRSTAIMLGARPAPHQMVIIPTPLQRYALALNLLLVGIILGPLVTNQLDYSRAATLWITGLEVILSILSLWILKQIARPEQSRGELNSSGMLHLLVIFMLMIVLFIPGMGAGLSTLVLLIFLSPLLTHSWLYAGILWGLQKSKLLREKEKKSV
jgi:4-hydroxybenzoate polyprenyltransferase